MWPAVVTHEDRQYPCTILDISERGAKLEATGTSLPKAHVQLQCDQFGSLDGLLIWSKGKLAGLRFDMAPVEIVQLLRPMVPGLDRREQAAQLRAPARPRASFGRRPRTAVEQMAAGNGEAAPSDPVDDSPEAEAAAV